MSAAPGSGSVSLATFLKRALPPDFSGEQWNHRRDKECIQAAEAHLSADPVPQWPKSLEHNRLSVEDYVALIRQKILERTKRPSDQYREGTLSMRRTVEGRRCSVLMFVLLQPSACLVARTTVFLGTRSGSCCARSWGSASMSRCQSSSSMLSTTTVRECATR